MKQLLVFMLLTCTVLGLMSPLLSFAMESNLMRPPTAAYGTLRAYRMAGHHGGGRGGGQGRNCNRTTTAAGAGAAVTTAKPAAAATTVATG